MEIGDEVIHFTGKPAMVTGKTTRSSEIDALVFAKVDPKEIKPADDKQFGFKKE